MLLCCCAIALLTWWGPLSTHRIELVALKYDAELLSRPLFELHLRDHAPLILNEALGLHQGRIEVLGAVELTFELI